MSTNASAPIVAPVTEVPRVLRYAVTQAHIERGERWHTRTCPIALAGRDAGYQEVRVYGNDDLPSEFDGWYYRASDATTAILNAYDRTGTMTPCIAEFTLVEGAPC